MLEFTLQLADVEQSWKAYFYSVWQASLMLIISTLFLHIFFIDLTIKQASINQAHQS